MARGVNRATLLGNCGSDPETRYTQGGMAVTKISLATTSVRKDRDGNNQEKTEWHRVTFFGKLGEIAAEYVRKGSQVYVEGRITYSEHTGDDGQKRYYTDIVADEMQLLGGSRNDGGERQSDGGGQRGESRGNGGGQRQQERSSGGGGSYERRPQQGRQQQPYQHQQEPDFNPADSDIPF